MAYRSALYPPNFQDLKEHSVCNVVPSVAKRSDTTIHVISGSLHPPSNPPHDIRHPGARAPVRFSSQRLPDNGSPSDPIASAESEVRQTIGTLRELSDAGSTGELCEFDNSSPVMDPVMIVPSPAVEAAKLVFRRRRGRVHQARYRRRKLKYFQHLSESHDNLREEIRQLNMQKQITALYVSMTSTSLSIVAEYFRLFRFGYDIHGGPTAMTQKHFLSNTMASDVTDGTVVGLEMLLKSWEFMTQCLPNVDMQPIRIENGPTGVIIATVSCTFTITESSLRLAFPHLSDRDEGYIIAVKLVGQELTMNGTYQFHYDEQSNRITCIKSTPDILTPLLSLLGSLENVAHLFENAVITPECKIA